MLIARIGCFQGVGKTAYGIDSIRLSEAVRRSEAAQPKELGAEPLQSHARALGDTRLKARLDPIVQSLRNFADEMRESLGEPFDKETYVREAKALLDHLEKPGAWPHQKFVKREIQKKSRRSG